MEPLGFLAILAAGALLISAAMLSGESARRGREDLMSQALRPWGGTVSPHTLVAESEGSFQYDGRQVLVTYYSTGGKHPTLHMQLSIATPELPLLQMYEQTMISGIGKALGAQDIEVGDREFDEFWTIKGHPEEGARELVTADVIRLVRLLGLEADNASIEVNLEGGELLIRRHKWIDYPPALTAYVRRGLELADELIGAHGRHWRAVAEARGLKLEVRAFKRSMIGEIDGVPVVARIKHGRRVSHTEARAEVQVPGGLHVVHCDLADQLEGPGVNLGNPVLDMLVVANADDTSAARAMLAREGLAESLLAVVHGHKGSALTPDEVVLRADGWRLEDIGELVDLVVDLAMRVRDA